MGFFSNLVGPGPMPPPPLQPVPQPIGVIPYYTQHRGQIALKVRERKMSFSGDDFAVKDAYNGQTMFQVDGSAFSFRQNKCESASDNMLLCFMIRSMYLFDDDDDDVLTCVRISSYSRQRRPRTKTIHHPAQTPLHPFYLPRHRPYLRLRPFHRQILSFLRYQAHSDLQEPSRGRTGPRTGLTWRSTGSECGDYDGGWGAGR
jgi:hypothetical protein